MNSNFCNVFKPNSKKFCIMEKDRNYFRYVNCLQNIVEYFMNVDSPINTTMAT